MKITVHRGTDQIGGCVTEYESNGWKLFVDYGEQLPGAPISDKQLEVEGLTHGDISKSALLITHHHSDHIGKIAELPMELPIYMGKMAKEIALGLANHLSRIGEQHRMMAERLNFVTTFVAGERFSFGEFDIMPIVVDHSAFDAYAFSIEAGGLKVFHTGDFRTHGFRSGKLTEVIEKYVGRVNYVVCEATNVNRHDSIFKPECNLQKEYERAFKENKYNVVYVSSTNFDRLFSLYHAAIKAHRPFYVDLYQKRIMDVVAGRDSIWGKSALYRYVDGNEPKTLKKQGSDFVVSDKFKNFTSEQGYVIIARQGKHFDNLLSRLPDEGRVKYLSMWEGYIDESNAAYNQALAMSVGDNYRHMHTSGHCDMKSLEELITVLNPYAIIPIHTDNPQAFADLFSDKWPVILLNDGESFSAIKDSWYDTTVAKIFAYKNPDKSHKVIDNPEGLQYWSLDEKILGEFQCWNDAELALRHVVYAPNRLLAYSIESEENMAPWLYVVYNPDLTEHSEYSEGGHEPGGFNYQEKCNYSQGDRIWAIIDNDVLLPCTFISPITEQFLREMYRKDGEIKEEKIDELISNLWDWDWDSVIVKPLVEVETELGEISSETTAQRIYIFPYKKLKL
ncbi:MAG: hypothetical protein IJ342_08155 [Muribaculaceae bacterium]|nr:hypothetical protein [Muribaculaceae bacterium]